MDPATVEQMQAQLKRLRDVRAKGLDGYTIQGRSLNFKSDAQLASAIADLERRLAAASGTPVRLVYFNSTKGI